MCCQFWDNSTKQYHMNITSLKLNLLMTWKRDSCSFEITRKHIIESMHFSNFVFNFPIRSNRPHGFPFNWIEAKHWWSCVKEISAVCIYYDATNCVTFPPNYWIYFSQDFIVGRVIIVFHKNHGVCSLCCCDSWSGPLKIL